MIKSDNTAGVENYSTIELQLAYRFLDGVFSQETHEEDDEDAFIPATAPKASLPPWPTSRAETDPTPVASTSGSNRPNRRPQSLDRVTLRPSIEESDRRASLALDDSHRPSVLPRRPPSPDVSSVGSDSDRITILLSPKTAGSSSTHTTDVSTGVNAGGSTGSASPYFPRSPSLAASSQFKNSGGGDKSRGNSLQPAVSTPASPTMSTPSRISSDESGSIMTRSSGDQPSAPVPWRTFRFSKTGPNLDELRGLGASDQEVCIVFDNVLGAKLVDTR
jgi:hypothetical protein